MHCENPRCMMTAQMRRNFLDPRRGSGKELAYIAKYFCSFECEEAIVDNLERQANYARLVN